MHCLLHKLIGAFLTWILQRLDHFMRAMVTNLRPEDFQDFTCILLINYGCCTADSLQEGGGLALVFSALVKNAQFLIPIELVDDWNEAHSFGQGCNQSAFVAVSECFDKITVLLACSIKLIVLSPSLVIFVGDYSLVSSVYTGARKQAILLVQFFMIQG